MSDTRSKFEEIWPVPEGIVWSMNIGTYVCNDEVRITMDLINKCMELDARLDTFTFTRCQETTAIYSSIVDDMIREMELINSVSTDLRAVGIAREAIGRAKQKMGMIK